ncbi:MAG: helicase, partial [Deltaproteobacteria bacterium]|nr:helicase [Deltaproteobacteria bacterium]
AESALDGPHHAEELLPREPRLVLTGVPAQLEQEEVSRRQQQRQGKQGRALGFVMTIFQKIAASSFAAVKATLRRRLLMLTIQEAVERDEILDVAGRDQALDEARVLIREMYGLADDPVGRAQVEQVLAEAKVQLLKKREEAAAFVQTAESADDAELTAATGEEAVATLVSVALPAERRRIRELLEKFPRQEETKTRVLLDALQQLWQVNPEEKVVVFTTYLGSIDSIKTVLEMTYPGKGVEVLKGGDHGAKTAAQRRFRRVDGPRVLLCTAAGREGINLQFARVLFNYDLPWNPMDLEQRIGRIHRYGQKDTAQVYNLVAVDTIEGKIFLLLEEKLHDIARTLGKVDEQGQVTEDLRAQILGQLGSRLSYDKLYQEAVCDPSFRRTRQEIEVAMENATLARAVVFEFFQDLEKFNLGDYRRVDDEGRGMQRLMAFVQRAARLDGGAFRQHNDDVYELVRPGQAAVRFTTDREKALQSEDLLLLGLESPVVKEWLDRYTSLPPEERSVIGRLASNGAVSGLVTVWQVVVHAKGGQLHQRTIRLGITPSGERSPYLERLSRELLKMHVAEEHRSLGWERLAPLVNGAASTLLHRELLYAGALPEGASYSSRLLACVEVAS